MKKDDKVYYIEGHEVFSAIVLAVGTKYVFVGSGVNEKLIPLDRIHASKEEALNALVAVLREELKPKNTYNPPCGQIVPWPRAMPKYCS
jgi:hypothetical protein